MRLITYALWGNNPKYNVGAIKNAESALELYPGWLCRFYCASDVPKQTIEKLSLFSNTEIVQTNEDSNWKYSVNRFLPISEDGIERIISRDTDSRITKREVDAVNTWILSDKSAHVMRDHPYHGSFPVLAGMFGIKNGVIKNVKALLNLAQQIPEQYHYDQIFLQNYIWPYIEKDVIIHDEFFTNNPFPTKRNKSEYVGQPFNEDDTPCFPEHSHMVNK
jgi:protein O-GlcNAc transferase